MIALTDPKLGYERLLRWCKKNNITVIEIFGVTSEIRFTDDDCANIYMPKEVNVRLKLYTLLHECGHSVIGHRLINERFGEGYSKQGYPSRVEKTLRFRIEVLDEELEAWNIGLELAKSLRIKIDNDLYKRYRDKCIKTYATLVVNPESAFYAKKKKQRKTRVIKIVQKRSTRTSLLNHF